MIGFAQVESLDSERLVMKMSLQSVVRDPLSASVASEILEN